MNRFLLFVKRYALPKSLFYRFVLIIFIPLLLLQVFTAVFFYERHWDLISKRLAYDTAGDIQVFATLMANTTDTEQQNVLLKQFKNALMLSGRFYAGEKLITAGQTGASSPRLEKLNLSLEKLPYPYVRGRYTDKGQTIFLQLPNGLLEVLIPQKRFFSSTIHVFWLWLLGSFILMFYIAFLFMRNQVRSIEKLSDAAEKFGKGLFEPFSPSGAKEVRQAGQSFNLMKNRLQRQLTERTALLAGVSHDLKTPLTRMKLQLSLMPRDTEIAYLTEDVEDMEKMLQGYLEFAKGQDKEEAKDLDITALVHETVLKARRLNQQITEEVSPSYTVIGRPLDLSRAFMNLLSNAGRYAQHTAVSFTQDKQNVVIRIDDDGPGIPPEQQENVFRAFYRLEKSRNQKTGGIGLGLTITRDIILSHGGDIMLGQSPLGGLRVSVILPKPQKQKR